MNWRLRNCGASRGSYPQLERTPTETRCLRVVHGMHGGGRSREEDGVALLSDCPVGPQDSVSGAGNASAEASEVSGENDSGSVMSAQQRSLA